VLIGRIRKDLSDPGAYSMISSARASSDGGSVTPIASVTEMVFCGQQQA
jgi:hypothetical protein